jgi:hypothetical protein
MENKFALTPWKMTMVRMRVSPLSHLRCAVIPSKVFPLQGQDDDGEAEGASATMVLCGCHQMFIFALGLFRLQTTRRHRWGCPAAAGIIAA